MKTKLFRRNILPLLGRGLGGGVLLLWGLEGGCMLFGQDLSLCHGKGYTLKSTADAPATGATSYTWQEKVNDGAFSEVSGETGASLHRNAKGSAGTYAYVRKAFGEDCPTGMPSNTFTVRVVPIPSVPSAPTHNGPTCAGTGITFSATKPGEATGLDWTGSVSGQGTSRTTAATTAGNYSAQVRSYLTSGEATCYSGWSGAATGTINDPAGTNQAVGACGCATDLTACNGYCRDLVADRAVCYNNVEIREICVGNDFLTSCGTEYILVTFSRSETMQILQRIWNERSLGHTTWTGETGSGCRYVCTRTECNICTTGGSTSYGWFGKR